MAVNKNNELVVRDRIQVEPSNLTYNEEFPCIWTEKI